MNKASLPDGWKSTTLGTFMNLKNGVNTNKGAYGKGIKFVNVMDIFKQHCLYKQDVTGSVEVTDRQLKEYSVIQGDVLFNRTSEIPQEIALSSIYLDDETITFGGFVIRGRQNKRLLLPEYAKYCFKANSVRKEMIRRCQGAIRANIGQKDLSQIAITIPPLPEQKAIASLLLQWDTTIEKTDALISAKEHQFKWLVKNLIDTPDFNRQSLKNIACMNSGGTPHSKVPEYYGGEIPWVSIADMTQKGMWVNFTHRTLTKLGLSNSNAQIYPKNTVLYAIYASIGECSIAGVALSSSQAILGIRPDAKKLHYEYLYYYFSSLKKKIKLQGQGGTQSNLNKGIVKNFKIPLPPLSEQKRIAKILNTNHREIELLQKQAQQYRSQKHGLMQKLLTGEWRIKK